MRLFLRLMMTAGTAGLGSVLAVAVYVVALLLGWHEDDEGLLLVTGCLNLLLVLVGAVIGWRLSRRIPPHAASCSSRMTRTGHTVYA